MSLPDSLLGSALSCFVKAVSLEPLDFDAAVANTSMSAQLTDARLPAEGWVVGRMRVDGAPAFVCELLYVEGKHSWPLPMLVAVAKREGDEVLVIVRCAPTYADAVDELEELRKVCIASRLAGLAKMRVMKAQMAKLLPSAQADLDQHDGRVAEITEWLAISGRDWRE
jgi:hypothetical protein